MSLAGFSPKAGANLFSDNFEMLVVAETSKTSPQPKGSPASAYCAVDGGFIEGGNPEAGDTPPTPDQVRQALYDALKAQGFEANRAAPSLLLTYHWGVLRPDRQEIRLQYGVKTNLNARIRLVSTEALGDEVENHILGRQKADGTNMNVSSPTLLVGPTETVVQLARHSRIFVIVTAYDYQAMSEGHEVWPVWRVKLSAQETSGGMDQVIPAMITTAAAYFGKNLPEPKITESRLAGNQGAGATPASLLQPAPEAKVDSQLLHSILERERIEFSGVNPAIPN